MKDTILNSFLVIAILSSILVAAIGSVSATWQTAIQGADQSIQADVRVDQMETTVVTAKRIAVETQLAAVTPR